MKKTLTNGLFCGVALGLALERPPVLEPDHVGSRDRGGKRRGDECARDSPEHGRLLGRDFRGFFDGPGTVPRQLSVYGMPARRCNQHSPAA